MNTIMLNSTFSTTKKMGKRQLEYLKVLRINCGMVTTSCIKYGIDKKTHYNWLKMYEGFKDAVEMINDEMIDRTESKLFQLIEKGEPSAIFFHLKCKGKKRGYVEKQEIECTGEQIIIIDDIVKGRDLSELSDNELRKIVNGGVKI